MLLDLPSIIVMSGVLGLLISVVFVFLRVSYPKSIKGLGFWAAAPALQSLALVLGLRGLLPDLLSIVVANLVLLTGMGFFYFGTQRFFNQAASFGRVLGLIAASAPLLVWFTVVQPSFNARVLVVTAIWLGALYLLVMLVWRLGKPTFSTHFTLVALLVHAAVLLLRFGTALLPLPDQGLFEPSRLQTLYIATNVVVVIAQCIGFILMASDRLREEFEHAAKHDAMTNALMRRAVFDLCEQELERCRRHGRKMVVLMLDIDHLKTINDTYGHQTGDRVLIDFANRIAPLLRRSDQFGRLGGEEFVVLLPETSQEEALVVAERIRTHVELPVKGVPSITVSMGMTSNRPDESKLDALLARADKALRKAKEAGGNRIEAV
jgi:diguanylate cyclase (GGDEF)-like protein